MNHWGTHNRQKKKNFHRIVCLSHREKALLQFLITGVSFGSPAVIDSQWPQQKSPRESENERADHFFQPSISWNIHTNRLTGLIRLIMFTVPADTGAVGRKGQFVFLLTNLCDFMCDHFALCESGYVGLCSVCFVLYCLGNECCETSESRLGQC